MCKKIIFLLLIFGLGTVVSASLVFGPREINLGKVKDGEIVERTIKIYSTSSEKVNILRIYSDCDCTDVKIEKKDIAPLGSSEFKIRFDSAKQDPGVFSKTIFVSYSAGEGQIKITGEVISGSSPRKVFSKPKSGSKPQAIYAEKAREKTVSGDKYIAYFYSAKCKECIGTKIILESVLSRNTGIEMKSFEVSERKSRLLLESMAVMYNISDEQKLTVPVLFAAASSDYLFLQGKGIKEQTLNNFFSASRRKNNAGIKQPWELASVYEKIAEQNIKNRFGNFEIVPVLFAGLVDGINPCAFGAAIFFITYITMILKKAPAEIFWIGINFILGVFAAYFSLGIGLLKFMSAMKSAHLLYYVLYFSVGILTLVLSFLSFVDYYSLKRKEKGMPAKVILQLPNFFKWKIYGIIEKYTGFKYLVVFAFAIGIAISLLEFFCTGQVYLPTIMYISGLPDYKVKAIIYLALYSLMFVVPLILVFSLVFWGVKSDMIEVFGKKYVMTAKFLNGVVFLLLAILIFLMAK